MMMCVPACRLLCLVELPTLDGVLAHDAVDGKHIVHNVTLVSRLFASKAHQHPPQPPSGKCQWHTLLPPGMAASLPVLLGLPCRICC